MDEQNKPPFEDAVDSSDECDNSNYVFYRDRPEWRDVKPVPQDDGPARVVQIAYSEKFSDVYNYFRAILLSQEMSQRALELVTDAIALNPANYTAWVHRLDMVKVLKIDLRKEVEYVSGVIREYTKNYQVWQYRKNIVEILNDPTGELEFTASILDMDAKNYHAWQYRQWILITHSHLLEKELSYVEELLSQDIRNNSAWNQRFFVISRSSPDDEVIDKEIDYTFNKIKMVSKNESAWNYLKGLLLCTDKQDVYEEKIRGFCMDLYNSGNRSIYLMSCIVELLKAENISDAPENIENKEKIVFALQLCFELAMVFDPIRRFYWAYISSGIEDKYEYEEQHAYKIDISDQMSKICI